MKHQPTDISTNIAAIYTTRTIGLWSTIVGILIYIGGPTKWQSHAYDVLNHMPGSPYTWGFIAIISGVSVIFGSIWRLHYKSLYLRNIGLGLTALWNFAFFVGFLWEAFATNQVSYNGPTTSLLICLLCLFLTKTRFTTHDGISEH